MSKDLNILAENKDALLLAEVAAWLHDMGKCSDEFIDRKNRNASHNKFRIEPYKAIINNLHTYNLGPFRDSREAEIDHQYALNKILDGKVVGLFNTLSPQLLTNCYSLAELIYFGRPTFISKIQSLMNKDPEPVEYLARSHASAHVEKEEGGNEESKYLSSPFGYEFKTYPKQTEKLNEIPFFKLKDFTAQRSVFLKDLEKIFKEAPGETRYPINEVDLWDWSSIVAALYKSALSGALLGNKPNSLNLKWRFLSVRLNSEEIWGESSSIPILLARKEWMETGLDNLKHLLEETYPLGNEVYRDENGSVFVVPYIEESEFNKALKDLIIETIHYDGEIQVNPTIQDKSWWGQYHKYKEDPEKNEVPPISSIISGDIPSISTNSNDVENWWKGKKCSICTVSRLRPADSRDSNRNISDYWLEKVTGRAKIWKGQQESTIWIDEVADSNGRICLLVGKLEILGWLKKGGYIETLLVKLPEKDSPEIKKTTSFARISRVWRTTKKFWEEVKINDLDKYRIDKRMKVFTEFKPKESNKIQINNSYEAVSEDDIRFTIFYAGNNEYIIIENLELIAKKIKSKYNNSDKKAHELIKEYLRGRNLKIYDSDGKKRDKPLDSLQVSDVISEDANYVPVIPILAEPSIFMAIVPADKALDISRGIKKKYEEEMGKVRNRLPLTLGMVFAKSHTPISSLMDAGRRMLKNTSKEQKWEVRSVNDDELCASSYMFRTLEFENGTKWKVPVTMRDGQTKDIWYPYFYFGDNEAGKPESREKSFKGPEGWLVHASEIEKGDVLRILPSTFDFEFLDSSSRKFEVYYDDEGKRWDKTKSLRPYLLEELDEFEKIWSIVGPKKLNRSQLKNVMYLLETKREEWPVEDEENVPVFRNYASDVLKNANWKQAKSEKEDFDKIVNAAVTGKLKDVIELYMDILKISENEQEDNGGI